MLTHCQDHILTENIWFVCSETSYMRGDVTDAGQTNERTKTEDRATQPMEVGGWVSQKDKSTIRHCVAGIEVTREYSLFSLKFCSGSHWSFSLISTVVVRMSLHSSATYSTICLFLTFRFVAISNWSLTSSVHRLCFSGVFANWTVCHQGNSIVVCNKLIEPRNSPFWAGTHY